MHLAVDALGIRHSGGASVLQAFLLAAVNDARIDRLTIFCSPGSERDFAFPASRKINACEQPLADRSRLYRLWWFERELPRCLERLRPDAVFCMSGAGQSPASVPQVTFIQQSLLFSQEAQRRFGFKDRLIISVLGQMSRRACQSSRKVLVQTPTMRSCVASAFGLDEQRVQYFLPGIAPVQPDTKSQTSLDVMRSVPEGLRLLYVGNQMPYKNIEVVAAAMQRIRRQLPGATLFLTWPENHPLTKIDGVVGCGYLTADALREAYHLATVLVMPSLVETVGLPMLEAMSVGTPVLAAARPYAHDICEQAAVFFDPLDSEDCAHKAIELLSDEPKRKELIACGLAVVKRRNESKPYEQMVDAVLDVVSGHAGEVRIAAEAPFKFL
ncbi:MAG: glycosyltransferase [Pyrinomonadaceae bacterium]